MQENPTPFTAGDIFYTRHEGGYHVSKLLRFDPDFDAYHVMIFEPLDHEPTAADLPKLEVVMLHVPIDRAGFENPVLLRNSPVTDDDLAGYREYIVQTHQVNELVRLAQDHYQRAYYLGDEKKHEEAIAQYTLAIELIPGFFEAIDNRAFTKMDLGRWEEAIADFELSLTVEPNSVLAEFSIGECYLKMKNIPMAIQQFEKVLKIDPNHALGQQFLAKAKALGGIA